MQTTIDRINEVANQLQHLYRLPRARRMRQRDQFAVLRGELRLLWQLHRKELAVISAGKPLMTERLHQLDEISYEELSLYTPSTRRNHHLQAFGELMLEVLAEMRAEPQPCHEQPLQQVHESRGQRLVWRVEAQQPVLIDRRGLT